jgi:predicted enzyme related to lactoylglutathione lyase
MSAQIIPGSVIFTHDHRRLAEFYKAVTGLTESYSDDQVTILRSETYELVLHAIRGESAVEDPPIPREDTYIKPFFVVTSLAEARERAAAFGGKLKPADKEWEARGFRASEAIDPDGNVIQFRCPQSSGRDSVPAPA